MSSHRVASRLPTGGQSLSPEARLLLCTAGGPEADAAIHALALEIRSWPRLLELGVAEGAHPVMGERLRRIGVAIPPDVIPALEYIERAASVRQRYLERRMVDALRILSSARIGVVLLKGAALTQTTYASFLERPMSDIDLLVRPDESARAQALLMNAGWEQHYDAEFDEYYETMHHLPPLIDSRAPSLTVGLEIHTAIVQRDRDPFAFSSERIWETARPATGLPPGTMIPSVVHRLFHCCLHFAWSHSLRKGAWRTFRDVSAMLRTEHIDWSDFVTVARESRAVKACYWTLRLARALALAPVPDGVLEELRPPRTTAVLAMLERHFSNSISDAERVCPSERLQAAVWTGVFHPGRDHHGNELPWKGQHRPWRAMRGDAAPGTATPQRSQARSPSAWIRYLNSILGRASRTAAAS
jgi:hypothetical protein